jgi:hypothetical protein
VQLRPELPLAPHETRLLIKVEQILAKTDGIVSYQTIGATASSPYPLIKPNYGFLFAPLEAVGERHGDALHVKGIMAGLQKQFAAIPEAVIFPFNIRR